MGFQYFTGIQSADTQNSSLDVKKTAVTLKILKKK